MNLKQYLSQRNKAKGKTKDWLPFCTLDITTGSLWAGDPHVANANDGYVAKVPRGRYIVEAIGMASGRDRIVSRLRVRLESAANPKLGKELGDTGTDSAMIGVCDIKAFDKACGPDSGEEVQEAIESQTEDGVGIVTLKKFPGAVMPFVPTGSDGTGPVLALTSGGKSIGIELPFMDEGETDEATPESEHVSLLGEDQADFITRLVNGKEVSFWGSQYSEGSLKFDLYSDASRGPVHYRVRRLRDSVAKDWTSMKKLTGGGATFRAIGTLKAGKYAVDFRIGTEVFSEVKLILK